MDTPSTWSSWDSGKPGRRSFRARQTTPVMKEYLESLKRKESEEESSKESIFVKRRRKRRKLPVKRLTHNVVVKKRMLKVVRKSVLVNQSVETTTDPVVIKDRSYTHVMNLGGDPPQYECKVCKRRFKSGLRVKLHKTCVSGEYANSCLVCGSGWHSKSELKRHVDRLHRIPKIVTCQQCEENFNSEYDWAEHVEQTHVAPEEAPPVAETTSVVVSKNQLEKLQNVSKKLEVEKNGVGVEVAAYRRQGETGVRKATVSIQMKSIRSTDSNNSKISSPQQDLDYQITNPGQSPTQETPISVRFPVAENVSSSSSDEVDVGINDQFEIETFATDLDQDWIEEEDEEDYEVEEDQRLSDVEDELVPVEERIDNNFQVDAAPNGNLWEEGEDSEINEFLSLFSIEALSIIRSFFDNEVEPYPF